MEKIMKRFMKNDYINSMINRFIFIFINLLTSMIISRYLGKYYLGKYSYNTNLINIIILFLGLGISELYPYYKKNKVKNIKEKYMDIFMLQFIVVFSFILFIKIFVIKSLELLVAMLIPIMLLNNQLKSLTLVENLKARNKMMLISNMFHTVLLICCLLIRENQYILVMLLLYIREIICIIFLIKKFNLKFSIKYIDIDLIINTIKKGIFPMLCALGVTFNYKVDLIILKWFTSYDLISLYSIGVSLANMAWIIPDAFKEVLMAKNVKDDSDKNIIFSIKINIYILIVILICMILFGKLILFVLYGREFIDSYLVTIIIFVGILPMIFFKIINTFYIVNGRQKYSFKIIWISVFINIIMNLVLIPKFDIYGAAISSVVSYSMCGFIFLYNYSKERDNHMKDFFVISVEEKNNLIKTLKRRL